MEVSTEEDDGTTDIIEILYEGKELFDKDFLDAIITFGYKRDNNKWVMMKYSELESCLE